MTTTSLASVLAVATLAFSFSLTGLYVFCLIVGMGYVLMVAILGTIGGGADHTGDFDHGGLGDFGQDLDVEHDLDLSADHGETAIGHHGQAVSGTHLGPFSPLIIALFLTCFGGTGLMFTRVASLGALSALPASASSLVFAVAAAWVFNRLFNRIEASSHATASDLLGRTAKVIVPIPIGPGAGQIAYLIKGTRYTITARSEDAVTLPQGAEVVILRLSGNSCFVAPRDSKRAADALKFRARADEALKR